MHRFFEIVDKEARLEHQHLADLMGIHKSTFSRVRSGKRKLTREFMENATDALLKIGIRKEDGTPYTSADLFFAPMVSTVSNREAVETAAD